MVEADETCPKCGSVFKPTDHFVRCNAKPCPMISTKDPRTVFEIMGWVAPPSTGTENGDG